MMNKDLLREAPEYGEEKYTENFIEKKCGCRKKGIEIIKGKKTDKKTDNETDNKTDNKIS